jgi:aerobic-type carbon monoxide dehydrogenase small subunit (CoxS/CutS family)
MVLIDGVATRSCVTSARAAVGKKIITIEGLEKNGRLHAVQEAFLEAEAMQCGYCTSGMIMSAAALLGKKANPTREEIVRSMDGNICRCGVYLRIIAAIEKAGRAAKEGAR